MKNRVSRYFLLSFPLILGLFAGWEIWEQDIFWQIRAGQDFWNTKTFATTESWSYTAAGTEWINFQWLANFFFFLAFSAGDAPGIVIFRILAVGVLFYFLKKHFCKLNPQFHSAAIFIVLPLIFVAIYHRLQLRSEFLPLIAFAFYTLTPDRLFVSLIVGILAANFHPGLLPFIVAWQGLRFFSKKFEKMWLLCLVALLAGFLITPYPLRVWSYLAEHVFYYDSRILGNPDHSAFGIGHLNLQNFGLGGWAWLLLSACGIALIFSAWKKTKNPIFLDGLVTAAAFTAFCLNRDRVIPFQIVAVFPYCVTAFNSLNFDFNPRIAKLLGALAILTLAGQLYLFDRQYRWRVSPAVFPIEEVRLLTQYDSKGVVFHTPSYGSYILTYAPQIKVFMDTRETPFLKHQHLFANALTPSGMQSVLTELGATLVVWPTPSPQLDEKAQPVDALEEFFPKKEWAVCSLGIKSVLLAKRVPENKDLIQEREINWSSSKFPHFALEQPSIVAEVSKCNSTAFPHISCLLLAEAFGVSYPRRPLYGSDKSYLDAMRVYYGEHPDTKIQAALDNFQK